MRVLPEDPPEAMEMARPPPAVVRIARSACTRAEADGASVFAAGSMEEESALCARALRGDMSAWNALVQKHNHRVVVSLLARGVRLDRAKDVAQDAWLRLIEQQREGRLMRLTLPGLAVTQAAFLALEAARRARRTEVLDGSAEALADPRMTAETKLLTEEQLARAEHILSRCSPTARAVFRLAYGEEATNHAEVAQKVGLSLQRVRQIVCEVRKLLREGVGHG
jgi:RNA polymerase sigma-70 factor (ECF subfamily)